MSARACCAGSFPQRSNTGPGAPPIVTGDQLLLAVGGTDCLLLATAGVDTLLLLV